MATSIPGGHTPSAKTRISRRSNVVSRVAESGAIRFFDLGAQTYWSIQAVYENLTESEADTLIDWLVTNETTELAIVLSTNTYHGYLNPTRQMSCTPNSANPNLWNVTFQLEGIKQ